MLLTGININNDRKTLLNKPAMAKTQRIYMQPTHDTVSFGGWQEDMAEHFAGKLIKESVGEDGDLVPKSSHI